MAGSEPARKAADASRVLGRYVLHGEIASGGMATVHFGRLIGPVGFSRTVAIKRMHPHLARDPELVAAFLDEARLAARINHPNVVQTLDVVATDGELFLVMDYVQGESLSRLMKQAAAVSAFPNVRVTSAIIIGALSGLHAAHEAKSDRGERLALVHRDVSPQNILVGADGVPRVLDFGVAKAAGRVQQTRDGELKGKLPYMAPEQIRGERVDRRTDVFAASVVLWEALTGQPLFRTVESGTSSYLVLTKEPQAPSTLAPHVPPELDAIVLRGLAKHREGRYATALDMAMALEAAVPPASAMETGAWVRYVAGHALAKRAKLVAEIESGGAAQPHPNIQDADEAQSVTHSDPRIDESPSSIATLSEGAAPQHRRRLTVRLGTVALLGVVALLVMWRFFAPRSARLLSPRSQDAVAPQMAEPLEAPTPYAPSAIEAPVDRKDTARKTRRATAHTRRAAVPSAAVPVAVPAAPKAINCDNPFVVDRDGTKRPRPECFR